MKCMDYNRECLCTQLGHLHGDGPFTKDLSIYDFVKKKDSFLNRAHHCDYFRPDSIPCGWTFLAGSFFATTINMSLSQHIPEAIYVYRSIESFT